MKTSVALASLLAVASTATTAKSAVAATPDASIKKDLKQAICLQDWNKAVELSSNLIASSTITPEYRQTLVDWRHRFSDYARDKTSFDKIPDCEGAQQRSVDIKVQSYQEPGPRFSSRASLATTPVCYIELDNGRAYDMGHLCISPEGSRLIDVARSLRRDSRVIEEAIQTERRYEESLANNARAQQGEAYADTGFWERSERFWEREIAETDIQLEQFADINQGINEVNSLGASLRLESGTTRSMQNLTRAQTSNWEWAIGTSGI